MTKPTMPQKAHAGIVPWLHVLILLVAGLMLSIGYWMIYTGRTAKLFDRRFLNVTQSKPNDLPQVEPVIISLSPVIEPLQIELITNYRIPVDKTEQREIGPTLTIHSDKETILDADLTAIQGRDDHQCISKSSLLNVNYEGNYTFVLTPSRTTPVANLELIVYGNCPRVNYAWPVIGVILIICAAVRFLQVFGWSRDNWRRKLKRSAETVFYPVGSDEL